MSEDGASDLMMAAQQQLAPWERLTLAVTIIRGVIEETEAPAVVKHYVIEKVKDMDGMMVDAEEMKGDGV